MDAENEKHLVDKSPNENDDDNKKDQPQNPENDSHPQPPKEAEAQAEIENREDQPTEASVEEKSPSSPDTIDMGKISQEIDQFISSLSAAKGRDGSELPDVPVTVVEQFAVLVEEQIERYDSGDSPVKWSQLSEEDSSSFLQAVDRISKLSASFSEFSSESKYSSSVNQIGRILQRAMLYLEEEFRSLLEDRQNSDPDRKNNNENAKAKQDSSPSNPENEGTEQSTLPESDDSAAEDEFPGYSLEVVSKLNKLANALMLAGYETECCQIYFIARRNGLDERLDELGVEKLSIDDVQKMQWESLEREIVSWIKTFKQCGKVHFCRERKLSEAVFGDYASVSAGIFSSLVRCLTIQLLYFAEAVTMTKRSTEKLFKFLDVYEALRDVIPGIDGPAECLEELKSEASMTRGRLGVAMVSIFSELENSIKADTGKTPVPGGAVHPLTRYTMNYLKYACEYKDTLEQVFREHQKIERSYSGLRSEDDGNAQTRDGVDQDAKQSPFQVQIAKVMDRLDGNLEAKSKLYKDPALSLIFMMNNGRYILQKIRGSAETSCLLGDNWIRKRSTDLRQYHKNYQRETWGKLLNCLNHEGLNVNGKVVKPVVKERFKSFNAMFDEIQKTQSTWVVSDEQLQSELRVSISAVVIPAYRSFMARFGQCLTPGRQTEKYVKYQPEDIETIVNELFDGNSAGKKR